MLLFRWHNEIKDFYFNNILITEKSYENILVYDISYKTLMSAIPMRISFDKVSGFIRICNGNKYLLCFWTWKMWCHLQ